MPRLFFIIICRDFHYTCVGVLAADAANKRWHCFMDDAVATNIPLTLASPLQSNMVIQQNKPFTIWGHATPGDAVQMKPTGCPALSPCMPTLRRLFRHRSRPRR
jgi:hypothetical protein